MNKLVYRRVGQRTQEVDIKDGGVVYDFAIGCLGSYFNEEFEEMDSNTHTAMEVAESFVKHYGGFSIEEQEEENND